MPRGESLVRCSDVADPSNHATTPDRALPVAGSCCFPCLIKMGGQDGDIDRWQCEVPQPGQRNQANRVHKDQDNDRLLYVGFFSVILLSVSGFIFANWKQSEILSKTLEQNTRQNEVNQQLGSAVIFLIIIILILICVYGCCQLR